MTTLTLNTLVTQMTRFLLQKSAVIWTSPGAGLLRQVGLVMNLWIMNKDVFLVQKILMLPILEINFALLIMTKLDL